MTLDCIIKYLLFPKNLTILYFLKPKYNLEEALPAEMERTNRANIRTFYNIGFLNKWRHLLLNSTLLPSIFLLFPILDKSYQKQLVTSLYGISGPFLALTV